MEYIKVSNLKVTCLATEDDFSFFGISFDDLLERNEAAFHFLKKAKELAGKNQKIEWTNTAYTLQISMLQDKRVSLTFSEEILDYVESLKNSMGLADESTKGPLKEFIDTLQTVDESKAREMVARFEKNVRNA